jgi:glycosyltransferase involved in cell wall biosynthesis
LLNTFRLGDDPFGDEAKSIKPDKNIPKEYFLSVGTIEARKNHALFYYVYKSAKAQKINFPKLVIAGKRGWLTEDIQKLIEKDPDVNRQIIIIDKIDDNALAWLYQNAALTIFPSFYEGWGLPVAESLMCGKVTLASNTSSIPEVGLANVDYFSPYSTNELMELMVKYSNSAKRIKREKELNYIKTAWDQTGLEFASKVDESLRAIL